MADGNAQKFFKDRVISAEKSVISAVIAASLGTGSQLGLLPKQQNR
jgi:hypothetical protein